MSSPGGKGQSPIDSPEKISAPGLGDSSNPPGKTQPKVDVAQPAAAGTASQANRSIALQRSLGNSRTNLLVQRSPDAPANQVGHGALPASNPPPTGSPASPSMGGAAGQKGSGPANPVKIPEQPTEKTADVRVSGDYFNYLLKDQIQWHISILGILGGFDLVIHVDKVFRQTLTTKQIAETSTAVLAAGIGLALKDGGIGVINDITETIETYGLQNSSTFMVTVDFFLVRKQFDQTEFDAYWKGLIETAGFVLLGSGLMIASGNFSGSKTTAKPAGAAAQPGPKTATQDGGWADKLTAQLNAMIDQARKERPTPVDLPDHVALWFNDRDQRWYLNIWGYFDARGKEKTAFPIPLVKGETPEQLFERAREATQKAFQRSEDRARRKEAEISAPPWAIRLEKNLRHRLEALHQQDKKAEDFPDGQSLGLGPDVFIQIWVQRGDSSIQRNQGSVPITPQTTLDELVPYVRHLAAILRQYENASMDQPPEGVEINLKDPDATTLAAFPSRIQPEDLPEDQTTVTGAKNEFHMVFDLEAVYGGGELKDLAIASKLYNQYMHLYWKIYRVPDQFSPVKGMKDMPSDWPERWEWLYNAFNPSKEDKQQGKKKTSQDLGAPVYETGGPDYTSRVEFPDVAGDYLVRCVTAHAPIGESKLKRASSDSYYPVRVKPIKVVARPLATRRTTAIEELESELKTIDALLAGGKLSANEREMALAKQQIKKGDLERIRKKETQTLGQNMAEEIRYANGMLVKVKQLKAVLPNVVAKAKETGVAPSELLQDKPEMLTMYWYLLSEGKTAEGYEQELTGQIKQMEEIHERAGEFASDLDPTSPNQYSLEAGFVSEITGQVYPLVMMLGESSKSNREALNFERNENFVAYTLVDITSSQTQKMYHGFSTQAGPEGHKEAIRRAFEDFGDDATYGEGLVAVRIPPGPGGANNPNHPGSQVQYYRSKEGILQKVLWALGIIAAIAGMAALAATGVGAGAAAGILGAIAAVAGAVTSVHNLSERSQRKKLEWDAETAMDIIGIIGVGPALVGARIATLPRTLANIEKIAVTSRYLQVYSWTEMGATVILVPKKLSDDIQRIQSDRTLTDDQKKIMIEQAKLGAFESGLMMVGGVAASHAGKMSSGSGGYHGEEFAALQKQIELLELEGFGGYKSMEERGLVDKQGGWTEQAGEIMGTKPAPAEPGVKPARPESHPGDVNKPKVDQPSAPVKQPEPDVKGKPSPPGADTPGPGPDVKEPPSKNPPETPEPPKPKVEDHPPKRKPEAEQPPADESQDADQSKPDAEKKAPGAQKEEPAVSGAKDKEPGGGEDEPSKKETGERPDQTEPPAKKKTKKQLKAEAREAERQAELQAEIDAYTKLYEESKARQKILLDEINKNQKEINDKKRERYEINKKFEEAAEARKAKQKTDIDVKKLREQYDELGEDIAHLEGENEKLGARLKDEFLAEKGITPERYAELRRKTPSKAVSKTIKDRAKGVDEVFGTPEQEDNPLVADHIVSMKEITQMKDFNRLPLKKQLEVLNLEANLIAMNKSANSSKQDQTWTEWKGWRQYTKDDQVPIRMQKMEAEARDALLKAIQARVPR